MGLKGCVWKNEFCSEKLSRFNLEFYGRLGRVFFFLLLLLDGFKNLVVVEKWRP